MIEGSDIHEYTDEVEDLFIKFFVTDPELFIRCMGIISEKHFEDPRNAKTIVFLQSHAEKYSTLPLPEQIAAVAGKKIEIMPVVRDSQKEWFLDAYERFARHKEMEIAILSSPELLEEGRYGEVEKAVKDAIGIGLVKNLGLDYFEDPEARIQAILDSRGAISTGWADVDKKLYGGMNRGEITIFAGQSGAGKSLFLQNLAVNWAKQGLNVLYITLELNENLCSLRLDAMITGFGTKEVTKNKGDVALKIGSFQKKFKGNLILKQLPNGCTANDVRAFVKEYEIQKGIKIDGILFDYLDLAMPLSKKVSPSDLFVKDKYVSEELRNVAIELDVLFATASQLNRGSHEEIEFDHSHISGGISKINTADNVIGIFTTITMKENGRYQIQFMKTRSSSGVGSKVDLAFDQNTLRISDLPPGASPSGTVNATAVTASLVRQGNVKTPGTNPVTPTPSSADSAKRLRDMMSKINQ